MPSIAEYLNIEIPIPQRMEIDGISFIGKLSADSLHAYSDGDNVHVSWKSLDQGPVKLWLATTNDFKKGKPDKYELISTLPGINQRFSFKITNPSSFYKIVLEGQSNFTNCWIIPQERSL